MRVVAVQVAFAASPVVAQIARARVASNPDIEEDGGFVVRKGARLGAFSVGRIK